MRPACVPARPPPRDRHEPERRSRAPAAGTSARAGSAGCRAQRSRPVGERTSSSRRRRTICSSRGLPGSANANRNRVGEIHTWLIALSGLEIQTTWPPGIGWPSVGFGRPADRFARSERSGVRPGAPRPAEERLAQLLPDGVEDAARVRAGVRSHALDAGIAEDRVVRVPAEDLVREEVEILVDAEAPAVKTSSTVTPYERYGSRVSRRFDSVGELPRGRAVLGRDDPVDDERAVEGDDRVPAARERPLVEADAVVHGPSGEREHRGGREGARPRKPASEPAREDEREEDETSTAFPGRARARSATPSPAVGERAAEGRSAARARRKRQSANAAANTARSRPRGRSARTRGRRAAPPPSLSRPTGRMCERPRSRPRPSRRRAPPARAPRARRRRRPATRRRRPASPACGRAATTGRAGRCREAGRMRDVLVEVAAGVERPAERAEGVDGEPERRRARAPRAASTRCARAQRPPSQQLASRGAASRPVIDRASRVTSTRLYEHASVTSDAVIVVRLAGGLGNQMFQYAAGRSLAERHDTELVLDTSWTEEVGGPTSSAASTSKPASVLSGRSRASPTRLRRPRAPANPAEPAPFRARHRRGAVDQRLRPRRLTAPDWTLHVRVLAVRGLLLRARGRIRRAFAFPPASARASGSQTRSGSHLQCRCTCGEATTRSTAISASSTRPTTPAQRRRSRTPWARSSCSSSPTTRSGVRRTSLRRDATIVDRPLAADRDWEDMWLMSLCRHHVISNSTYGWWGAWLNPSPSKIVVAPRSGSRTRRRLGDPVPRVGSGSDSGRPTQLAGNRLSCASAPWCKRHARRVFGRSCKDLELLRERAAHGR